MEERIKKLEPTKLEEELKIIKTETKAPANPIMQEVSRVKNLMNQAMGIKENLINEEQESIVEKTLTTSHPELMKSRRKELTPNKEFLE